MSETPASQPLPEIVQVQLKYTNNCNRLGDLTCQINVMHQQIQALVQENAKLQAEYARLKKEAADAAPQSTAQ